MNNTFLAKTKFKLAHKIYSAKCWKKKRNIYYQLYITKKSNKAIILMKMQNIKNPYCEKEMVPVMAHNYINFVG